MNIMNSEYIFSCKRCDIEFKTKYNLDRHLQTNCRYIKEDIIKRIQNSSKEFFFDNKLKCNICEKHFSKNKKLEIHLSSNKGKCFKLRSKEDANKITKTNIEKQIINNYNYQQNITQNINNLNQIAIQPILKNVVLAKHGEETISHITKERMLELLKTKSFPVMCTELMRMLYFNDEVPENRNWTIIYPKNKNGGIKYNYNSKEFERTETYDIIDDKFSNMLELLFDLIQEIERDDLIHHNLSDRQRANLNRYCIEYGQYHISKTAVPIYTAIHKMAYEERKNQMKSWGENGHKGNHLSLKF